jgi:hypothetical protein
MRDPLGVPLARGMAWWKALIGEIGERLGWW